MQHAELYVNDILLDLPNDSLIALSYAVNTLTDLKSVQGNISNSISLPDTANNRRALSYPEDLNFNGASVIRKKQPCRYVQNGVDVIPQGSLRIVGANKGALKIVISSGNTDFFDLLTGKLRDLDLSAYDHRWNNTNVLNSRTSTNGYIYPIINYGNLKNDDSIFGQGINPRQMRPAVFVSTIVEKIITQAGTLNSAGVNIPAGYTFNNLILADPVTAPIYQNLLLPFSDDKLIHPQRYLDQYSPNDIEVKTYDIPDRASDLGTIIPIPFNNKVADAGNYFDGTYWTAPGIMTVNVLVTFPHIHVHRSNGGNNSRGAYFKMYLRPASGGGDVKLVEHSPLDFNTSDDHEGQWYDVSMTVDALAVNPGDKIFVAYEASGDHVTVHIDANADLTIKLNGDNVLFGEQLQIEGALPDMTTADFLKFIQFYFCAVIQTDNINKVVTIVPFGHIIQNMPFAVDWSDKVTNDGEDFDVQIGDYCQQNEAKWKHDDTVTPDTYANGSFYLPDENLDLYQDIYDLPLAASYETLVLGNKRVLFINKIPDITASDEMVTQTEQRLCLLNKQNIALRYHYDDGSFSDVTDNVPLTYFSAGNPSLPDLTLKSIFANHYQDLVNVLSDQRKLTCYLMLNEMDIQELDFFKPVYIGKYQSYFYISKITDFTGIKPVKVELIRL